MSYRGSTATAGNTVIYRAFTIFFTTFTLMIFAPVYSQQFDAPFYALQKRHQDQWQQEDKQIERKLAALEKRFKKKPNIIFILTDDIGWGELGWQGGGKHRGTPTPTLDRMASEGMRFWAAYAEPSCTPTRIAINTGRHPVRTGLLSVLWPGQPEGLSPKEVTIAELLSDAGYHTAMWGKWHLGDAPEHAPENQGFEQSYYGLFNGAPDAWQDSQAMYETPMPVNAAFHDFPGYEEYAERTGIDLSVAGYIGAKGKPRKPIPGPAGKLGFGRQEAFENESNRQMLDYIRDKAGSDRPFFIYWASYALQITGARAHQQDAGVDKVNAQASMMVLHNKHVDNLLKTLEAEGIDENTLVVWWSDNGPMYAYYPTSGYTLLRGAKGDTLEGGVRVPAMAWWPGMIEPNQDPVDIIHVTDLFTTAAYLAGVKEKIPGDRVTDGIDQTALLLLGEGHGRRNYMMHYSGPKLAAVRYEDFKVHLTQPKGGLPGMEFYNVKRDPGERYGKLYPGLFAVAPIQKFIGSHEALIEKFPNRDPAESRAKQHD
ncbi:sulfatase-like hydrolase/transferase [Microbulbifer sp. TYP-18]|uniref:sulfatase-like hydrolase/transferase n=1 Tax=Microbulbifer sp. TYP-18 TaxID=3230024 RepID=UPI0034C6DAFD